MRKNAIERRKYQEDIADQCSIKNSLVVLPTGLGKTAVAVLVAARILERSPVDSKVLILAPTRPLIDQHRDTFTRTLDIPSVNFCELTGKTLPEKRAELFEKSQIIFFTPQTLRNDLINDRYSLETTCLIVFDEAHHASGDYPYPLIAEKFAEQCSDGIVLALTASPGSSREKIDQLCRELHVPTENVFVRTRQDDDVKKYVKPMDIYKIGVNLTDAMKNVHEALRFVLEKRLQYLLQAGFLKKQSNKSQKKVIRKDLLALNTELIYKLNNGGDLPGLRPAISINAQALIVFYMIELVEQQGLDILLKYLEKVNRDAQKTSSSKAIKSLSEDFQLRKIYALLKKIQNESPESLTHPKFNALMRVVLEELARYSNSKILIFAKLRESVKMIAELLKKQNSIKPVRFVGQASKSKEDKGLTQKQQIEILERFKAGKYNALISTNVGEEGLDVAECDLVIFYDVVASEIRLIQRKGRTARHREGKVIILYCKDTSDELYLEIALKKQKIMNANLKQREEFNYNSINKHEGQSSLTSFLTESHLEGTRNNISTQINKDLLAPAKIRIERNLPLKFGLRKWLIKEEIPFDFHDTGEHVVVNNKILLQLHNPRTFSPVNSINAIQTFKNKREFVIIALDFVKFKENFRGEKAIVKKKAQEFGDRNKIQVVSIDDSEELSFLVKSLIGSKR